MDERLPLGSTDAPTLRMLLEKEHAHRAELEQDIVQLRASLVRQNDVIFELRQRDALRERQFAQMQTLLDAVTEQNTLLRQQVAQLEQENAQLRGVPLAAAPDPVPEVKPAAPIREPKVRKKRAAEHNRGRLKLERATRWETHAAEQCPQCGERLEGGWIVRRVQMIDLAPVAPLEVTEHRILRRQCPRCGTRALPKAVGVEAGRIGRCRFGPRLIAAIATMRTVERLPIRIIQERLQREYGLVISQGGIVGLLQRMAAAGKTTYDQIQQEVRASRVVYADETGWRENGQHSQRVPCATRRPAEAVWTVSTTQQVYVAHGRRTSEAIDGILGAEFGAPSWRTATLPTTTSTVPSSGAGHFRGPARSAGDPLSMVRDLEALLHEQGHDAETVTWAEGVLSAYAMATTPRSAAEEGVTPQAAHAREQRARGYEALILLLCPAQPDANLPYATLAKRLRSHLAELFTFVRDPEVDATKDYAPHCTSCGSSKIGSGWRLRPLCLHFTGASSVGAA